MLHWEGSVVAAGCCHPDNALRLRRYVVIGECARADNREALQRSNDKCGSESRLGD